MQSKMIGEGRTAQIFDYENNKALKLFYDEFCDMGAIEKELAGSAVAFSAGVPTPKAYGLSDADGRKGIIYDKVEGISLGAALGKNPLKIKKFARMAAYAHSRVSLSPSEGLVSQPEMYSYRIANAELSYKDKSCIIDYAFSLPDTQKLCHGDLHAENYIYSKGNLYIIDWMSAYSGNPAGDVARTMLLMSSPVITAGQPAAKAKLIQSVLHLYNKYFLDEYTKLSGLDEGMIEKFMLPTAAIRLTENIPYEKEWLLEIIANRLRTC